MNSFPKPIACLLLGFSLFVACKHSETMPPADQVSLRLNESAKIGDITVRVDSLRGQGCVQCIFAYNAFVSATVLSATAQQRVKLILYGSASREDSTGVTLSGQTYKVILRDVVPHPDLTKPLVEPKAIIQVSKL